MFRHLDFSARGKARVALITAVGTGVTLLIAVWAALQVTQDMPPNQGGIPIVLAIGLSLALSAPIYYFFANKLRQLAIAHHELAIIASQDSLTTCLNRGAFITLVDAYLTQVNAPKPVSGALFVVDADHFKTINDRYGHAGGDEALKLIAAAIRSAVRPTDLVGRVGGEEFAVLLPHADASVARQVAERIRQAVGAIVFRPNEISSPLSVSLGATVFAGPAPFEDIFKAADRLLYRAKAQGRNRIIIEPYSSNPDTG
jgi:diguanylate cyclase